MELKPLFRDIAAAIREKEGTTELIPANTFAQRIRAIETGGALPNNVRTITLIADPPEGGTVSGGGAALDGMTVTVCAEAAGGYSPAVWQENGKTVSEDAKYTFSVLGERTLTAVFSAKPASRLPDGYTEVEYISNPNLTYIKNMNVPRDGSGNYYRKYRYEYEILFLDTDTGKEYITGTYYQIIPTSGSQTKNIYLFYREMNSIKISQETQNSANPKLYSVELNESITSKKSKIIIDEQKGKLILNGSEAELPSTVSTFNDINVPLYARYYYYKKNSATAPATTVKYDLISNFKFYNLKIYESTADTTGELLCDYVPCIDPDGQVGIYDLVRNLFFTSSESGKYFEAGPAVS